MQVPLLLLIFSYRTLNKKINKWTKPAGTMYYLGEDRVK